MNAPRLLPLVGVAVAGVLAINFLAGARDLPGLLAGARANAEAAQKAGPKSGPKIGPKNGEPGAASADGPAAGATSPLPPRPLAASAAAVCSPSGVELAKAAGLSPGELQILQSLQERRVQIDQQAKDVDAQTALLNAAEAKLDAKLKAMGALKDQIQALLGQADQRTQGEVDRLVVVYSKMPPKSAAPIMAQLDDKVRVPVAAAMKPAILAAVLKEMAPADAKRLTELLAHRFSNVQQLADAARQPPPGAPASGAPTAAKAPAKPAPAAQAKADTAAPSPDDANVEEPTAKPVRTAHRAKPRPRPRAAPAKRVEQASSGGPKPYSAVKDAPAAATPAAAAASPAPPPASKT